MKKIICAFLSIVLLLALMAGCSSENAPVAKEPQNDDGIEATSASQENTQPQEKPTEKKEQTQILTVPFKSVTVECRVDRVVRKEGLATVVYESKKALVAFCRDMVYTYDIELEDVFSVFEMTIPAAVSTMCEGDIAGETIEMVSSEEVQIAGFDSIRFTGKLPNTFGWDCHVYGYTFLIEDVPYAVIGIVSEKEQSADLIAANMAEVDEITATIKNG